ncbi:MAG TPA: DsbA family protein [Steroidobacteraceae bacterium]|nr:DsbA family protein [Steroidobacteraceae bacterium]
MSERITVSWVFDVISPFAYLGLHDLERLPAHIDLRFVPVLFAGMLSHFGQVGPAEIPSKRRFTNRFVLWRARQLGLPMRFPPAHPFNPLAALRLVLAAGSDRRAAAMVLEAVFGEGRDVTDPRVIAELAGRLGVADVERTLSEPAVKQRLRDNTDWAISLGIFGVPTLVIGRELFWGHDAFGMALDYLNDRAGFVDPEMQALETLRVGVERRR